MDSPGHHRRGQVMRAGHDVGHDLGFGGIGHRGFEDAYDGGCALTKAAEPDGLANHLGIAPEHGRPESIAQDHGASGLRAIVLRAKQPSEDWVQPHDLEIRSADDPRADLTWFAKADHGKADRGKLAELSERFDAGTHILNFWNGERCVFGPHSACTLADINQAVLVTVD